MEVFLLIIVRIIVFDMPLGTLSIEDVGCHVRSPEVIFHLSSDVAMDTPSVPDDASRLQRRIAQFAVLEKT